MQSEVILVGGGGGCFKGGAGFVFLFIRLDSNLKVVAVKEKGLDLRKEGLIVSNHFFVKRSRMETAYFSTFCKAPYRIPSPSAMYLPSLPYKRLSPLYQYLKTLTRI